MANLAERDFFTDYQVLKDPYAYFDAVRAIGPVCRLKNGVVVVTGHEEVLAVLRDAEVFSSAIALQGAGAPLPFVANGPDIDREIDAHRADFIGGDLLVNYDDRQHAMSRGLLMRLFTPSRLRANEEFMAAYADELVRNAVAAGGCELIKEIATPFVTMVIADLLGVPAADRQFFMQTIDSSPPPGSLESGNAPSHDHPLKFMEAFFADYVRDRRANPREDVMSELSNATFIDGSVPDTMEIARLASFLFGAGQDTSAKLLGNAMVFIVDQPGLQHRLRGDPALIPQLIEEVLRLEGSSKITSRLARRDTLVGGVPIEAGTRLLLALTGANRDPARWEAPSEFRLDRPKAKEHLSFGRGAHVCAGAPLARAEVRVMLEKFLELTSHIDLVEARHGPRGRRELDFEPSFIIRGLSELHLELSPA